MTIAPLVWWFCEMCGVRVKGSVRAAERGELECPDCKCTSWSRLPSSRSEPPPSVLGRRRERFQVPKERRL